MTSLADRLRDRPLLALAALLAVVLVVGGVQALLTPDRQLSAYGDGAADLGQARVALEETGFPIGNTLTSPHLLEGVEEPRSYLYVVAGVEEQYTDAEVAAIVSFVEDGGNLILADDFGFGNDVASEFDVSFTGRVLRDDAYRGNRSFVEVNATLPDGRDATLLTNVPTGLSVSSSSDGRVLARTSGNAYVDVNGNGMEDEQDLGGPFPVAYRTSAGAGEVVFLSDPGLLTNQALSAEDADNRVFFRALTVDLLPDRGVVVFDESRHSPPLGLALPLGAAGAVVAGTQEPFLGSLTFVAVVGSLAMGALLLTAPPSFGVHRQDLDRVRRPPADSERRGARLQALALQRVAEVHELRGSHDEVRDQALEVVEDPTLRDLLEAEGPSVRREAGSDLLERIESYAPEDAPRQEVPA